MYSYDDRLRAVRLYIKLGKRIGLTIRQLGYPTKNALKTWCREYERRHDVSTRYTRAPKFSQAWCRAPPRAATHRHGSTQHLAWPGSPKGATSTCKATKHAEDRPLAADQQPALHRFVKPKLHKYSRLCNLGMCLKQPTPSPVCPAQSRSLWRCWGVTFAWVANGARNLCAPGRCVWMSRCRR